MKQVTISTYFIVMVLFLVGCKNDKSETKSDKKEKIVLTMTAGSVGKELQITKKMIDNYMKKNPHVEIKLIETPNSATDRFALYLQFLEAKSSDVDIYFIDVVWPGDLAEHLIDLNKYGAKQYTKDHFKTMIKNNTVNGKLVAMPWFSDAGLIYYRKDLLKKYKLDTPKTWDQLEKAALTIQNGERAVNKTKDFWGFIWQGDSYEGLTCVALEWIASHNGGTMISDDKKITINNPHTITALSRAKKWIGTISPPAVIEYDEEKTRAVWQSGNAAFMRNWPYVYALSNEDNSAVKDRFDVMPIPGLKEGMGRSTLGGWQLGVSSYSKHKKAAAQFVFYLTSKEVQKINALEGSKNPTIKSLYSDKEILKKYPFFKTMFHVFQNAIARPSSVASPKYSKVSTIFYTNIYNMLSGKLSSKEAVKIMELELKDATSLKLKKN